MADTRVIGLTLAYLFGLGAALVLVTLALPHPPDRDLAGLIVPAALAAVTALIAFLGRRRIPLWAFRLFPTCGTVLATVVVYSGGAALVGEYSLFYFWVVVAEFYFFSRMWGVLNLSIVGVAYALVLGLHPGVTDPEQRWLITIWTLAAAGLLLGLLREHVQRLVGRLARHVRDAEEQSQSVQAIADAAREIARNVEPAAIRPAVCSGARRATGAGTAVLYEPTSDGRGLRMTGSAGSPEVPDLLLFTGPGSAATSVFTTGEPVFIADLASHPLTHHHARGLPHASGLWQPVLRGDASIAVLCLLWPHRVTSVPPRAATLVTLLAEEASAAIERARLLSALEETARTDPLTGLPNRRAWDEALAREMARALREKRPLSVAILDLDHFKSYNDAHGHLAGDRLLKELAGVWTAQVRAIDTLARFGGEEFTLAFPACTLQDSLPLVQRLREFTAGGLTCSAGLALWDGSEDADGLLERADRALYRAKQDGRDRTMVD